MTKEDLLRGYPEEPLVFVDGLDEAILGVTYTDPKVVVYSLKKTIEILAEDEEPEDDIPPDVAARSHFDYNIGGAYVGERTPIFVEDE